MQVQLDRGKRDAPQGFLIPAAHVDLAAKLQSYRIKRSR
jgi:hypothetical protein